MKKLVFMLIAALCAVLASCVSDATKPSIIGTGTVQYEAKSATYFVAIDSMQYTITAVTIPDHNRLSSMRSTNNVALYKGVVVTVITSPTGKGVQAIVGEHSVQQVDEWYQQSDRAKKPTIVYIAMFIIIAGLGTWILIFIGKALGRSIE